MILAIDTSSEMAGLALTEDSHLIAELTWKAGLNHTTQLMLRLNTLLEQSGVEIKKVTGIVVATGPGSFNGLRAGISGAKGLAFSLGVPIAGISTLEMTAYQHADCGLPVCAILNAGLGQIAAATFQKRAKEWTRVAEEHLTTLDILALEITTPTIFTGEYVPKIGADLIVRLGNLTIIPSKPGLYRRAGFLAELGEQRIKGGTADNLITLQPLYLRRPHITEPKPGKKQFSTPAAGEGVQ